MLAQANPSAPPPFQADSTAMSWMLPATATLPDVDNTLAPLPVLVTVASRPGGDHLLIDLERTGLLTLGGEPERSRDLIRYIAAELAANQWSDDAEVVLAGFDPVDVDHLLSIGGNRITAATSTANAIERARRRAAANAKAMTDTGITTTFAGRIADTWMPHVLLIADTTNIDEQLTALTDELRMAGRCAAAVAAVTETPTTWHVDVSADGSLAIDWLSITNTTASRLPATNSPASHPSCAPPAPPPHRRRAGACRARAGAVGGGHRRARTPARRQRRSGAGPGRATGRERCTRRPRRRTPDEERTRTGRAAGRARTRSHPGARPKPAPP